LADGGIVKVADFGLARQMEDYEYKKNGDVIYSFHSNLNENINNCLLKITGIIASQMDGY
jgi:hypothetical protein